MNCAAWLTQGLDWSMQVALRASLLVIVATMAALALRKKAASLRRQVWAGTIVGLLMLPILSAVFPHIAAPLLPSARQPGTPPLANQEFPAPYWATPRPSDVKASHLDSLSEKAPKQPGGGSTSAAKPWPRTATVVLALYVVGLLISLRKLIRARRKANQLARTAINAPALWQRAQNLDVRETDLLQLPITVGAIYPVILVPTDGRGWSAQWRQATLAHEVAHVEAKDPLLQLLAELCVAMFWFHPLVHLAVRQLRSERELAADDAVLATGIRGVDYAALLFELACLPDDPPATGALVPLLTPAGLKVRVVRVLDENRKRMRSQPARMVLVALGAMVMLPLAIATPTTQARRPGLGLGLGPAIGRLVDESSGRPVAGAAVTFRFERWPPLTSSVLSDEHGIFQYPWNQPLEEYFGVYARSGDRAARMAMLGVPLGTKFPANMPMRRAATLSGFVRTHDDKPVENASVCIWLEGDAFGPGRDAVAKTDQHGFWRMAGILYGEYRLLFTAPWGVRASEKVDVSSKDVANIDVLIPRQWPRTGWLHDEDGKPLSHFRFTTGTYQVQVAGISMATRGDGPLGERHLDWEETEEDGSFSLLSVGQSLPIFGATPDGTAHFGTLQHYETQPRIYTLSKGLRVSGVVTRSSGEPVGKAIVQVFSPMADLANAMTISGDNGTFVLNSVPPGDVVLMAGEPMPDAPYLRSRSELRLKLQPMNLNDVKIVLEGPWQAR